MHREDLADIQIPLADVIDLEMLMHRDVHFGGNFDIMLDYYRNHGVGVMPDFSIHRMMELKQIEEKIGRNLSEILLPSPAKETVETAKKFYLNLRDVYHQQNPPPLILKMSSLILSEEQTPKQEMKDLVELGAEAVPRLIDLLGSHTFYDPLYPGYGRAPLFAAMCLAEIGDERAIIPLFEALGKENFFIDEELIKALKSFGDKTKHFLLKILTKKPLSKDNDHAAIVLTEFAEDPSISKAFLTLLNDEEVLARISLAPYLIFGCSPLKNPEDRDLFKHIAHSPKIPKELKMEMEAVLKTWKKTP